MAFVDDFSFDVTNGNLRAVAGTTRYQVIDAHRYLMSLTGSATKAGDDLLDITDLFVPSKRNSDTDIEFLGNVNIDAATAERLYGGSITYGSNQERYSGLAIAGVFNANALPQVFQNNAKLTSYWGFSFSPDAGLGYACRILVKSLTGGASIDGGRVRVQSRGYGYQYREAKTVLGRNESVAAVGAIAIDTFSNTTDFPAATIATYTDIAPTEGYHSLDYANGNGATPFYMSWAKGTRTKADVYPRIKWETRDGSAETIFGLNGEYFRGATHEIPVDTPTGTFPAFEEVSWAGGTGQMLAIDSATAGTTMWIQLLTGVAPTDNQTITGVSTATVDVNGTAIDLALGAESVAGNFTGSWITSIGVGMAVLDVNETDKLLNLLGTTQAPPTNRSVDITGLVAAEDRIIVGKSIDGGLSIDKAEYAAAAGNNLGDGTIVVQTAISNIPASGWVRISNGVGEDVYPYASFSGSTFTLDAVTLSQNYTTGVDVYPTIIDKVAGASTESNAWTYTADTDLAGQVLDSGGSPTKAFPISGTFTNTGYSVNVVRTPDV